MRTLDLFSRTAAEDAVWTEIHKGHRRFVELADRHYTRQSHGSNQVLRPGVNFPLLLSDGTAAWNVWRPIPEVGRKDDLEAWECTLFRNEGGARRSSQLIAEATALVFRRWGWPPVDGLISAVGVKQTERRRSRNSLPGQCFRMAGWMEFPHHGDDPNKVWLRAPHPQKVKQE